MALPPLHNSVTQAMVQYIHLHFLDRYYRLAIVHAGHCSSPHASQRDCCNVHGTARIPHPIHWYRIPPLHLFVFLYGRSGAWLFESRFFRNNTIAEYEWSNVVTAKCTREKLEGRMPPCLSRDAPRCPVEGYIADLGVKRLVC